MKKYVVVLCFTFLAFYVLNAQKLYDKDVPAAVKSAFEKKYSQAKNVKWENEKGNYEANWGGN